MPLKKGALLFTPLLLCLKDNKAWMALNFLNFNDNKTEVKMFCPSSSCDASPVDLGPLTLYLKQTVSNLGFRIGCDLKLDCQLRAVVKACFYHFTQLAKIKSILLAQHLK